jgi:phosphoglycerol transferase MdoB-like AlkP superfamily enzyme
MGFDSVFSAETALPHSADYATRLLGASLNDRDVFGELIRFLKERAENPQRRPVFIGTYNVGTHAFGQILPSGLKYTDGTNVVLDRFHNYDAEFGRFLDYFLSSPYAEDTILIFTADHATYPEPPFRAIAGDHYKPYFVDRVPLLIYDPFHELPSSFDANGRTTLALAPTVLQLLGIRSGANSFMGRTVFSTRKLPFGVAAIGQEFYVTDTSGVYSEAEVPDAYRADFQRRKKVIELYYQMESQNRVFK